MEAALGLPTVYTFRVNSLLLSQISQNGSTGQEGPKVVINLSSDTRVCIAIWVGE